MKKGLVNSVAIFGEEFSLSVELSAVCSGFWSLNGRMLRSGADYLITRSKNIHTLTIREVTMEMNGFEVKFVAGGSETSCVLSVKGKHPFRTVCCNLNTFLLPLVSFSAPFSIRRSTTAVVDPYNG